MQPRGTGKVEVEERMAIRVEPVGFPMGREKGAGGEAESDWLEMTPTVVSLKGRMEAREGREEMEES
jgi:hypothetical protein